MKACCYFIVFSLLFAAGVQPVAAQLGFDLAIKKPAPYQDRELKAEKSGDKKFTAPRRIVQNTFTHYNYFFNANNKLNEIVARAKTAYKDDYSQLLPFYNYQLSTTAQDKDQLDSVIYKAKTGVLLHDLRNDWIDDMYLLWGEAYYLQQQYDSAYQMFQFINYAFADKEKDGYYKYIGSRLDGAAATNIASSEKMSIAKRLIADKPSRNTALLWEVRSLIGADAMVEAGSLMTALRNDPSYPERLKADLEEVQAYWYYKQERWDSAAMHLQGALSNATDRQERARWEFLVAQLFEKSNKDTLAIALYNKAIAHTVDPVLELYARLNLIRLNKTGGDNYIEQNVQALLKMARRDKYVDYRDAIYYMAGEMELARSNYPKAEEYFLKSSKYKSETATTGSKGFLQLANLYFNQKNYVQSARFYDSVQTESLSEDTAQLITTRKDMLIGLLTQLNTVQRQDSLQRIAALPEKERNDYIKKLGRQLRRQHGMADETAPNNNPAAANIPDKQQPDFFSGTDGKGDKGGWYFYNDNARGQGEAAFKRVWGKRPNVDNWRRFSDVTAQLQNESPDNTRGNPDEIQVDESVAYSNEGLLANLPLTEEKMQASNDSISNALFAAGRLLTDRFEDYESAIKTYEELRKRFPKFASMEEALFQLYYSYTKTGDKAKAAEIKALLDKEFPGGRYTTIAATGKDATADTTEKAATTAYESVYDLFLEGKFDEAKAAKQQADSTYGTSTWSPQLMYIEAVYYIKKGEDSLAKDALNELIQQAGDSPIGLKATNLLSVLRRRHQIEDELRRLQIERPKEEPRVVIPENVNVVAAKTAQMARDSASLRTDTALKQAAPVRHDTLAIKAAPPPNRPKVFTYQPAEVHYAVILLNKVDVVFGNEAKNAFARYNRERYSSLPLDLNVVAFNDSLKLLTIGTFENVQGAVDYVQKAKALAATEIVPWLKGDKYSFSIISENNLLLLQENHDLAGYRKFLDQNLPVKF